MKNKTVLFYSSVQSLESFQRQLFYKIDIEILEELGYTVLLSNKITDALKFWKYNFVFSYFYRYSFFVALIAKIFFKNTYITGGIDDLDKDYATSRKYNVQKIMFLLCYSVSKKCIVVSLSDKQNILKIIKSDFLNKLEFSEHSLDTISFTSLECNKENIFCTIAWMEIGVENVIRKGIAKSLYLFKYLISKEEFYDYKYIIIGAKGDGSDYLSSIISNLGIADSVIFTGAISESDKLNILSKSKYYFQLSSYEGFGLAAIEALLSKNIVIHSAKGGLKHTIKNDGVIYNIKSENVNSENELAYEKIKAYQNSRLDENYKYYLNRFDNSRRAKELKQILI